MEGLISRVEQHDLSRLFNNILDLLLLSLWCQKLGAGIPILSGNDISTVCSHLAGICLGGG